MTVNIFFCYIISHKSFYWVYKNYVSLWLAAFCLTKSLKCNVATYSGIPFISESSIQKCSSRNSNKILCRFQVRPKLPFEQPIHASGRPSVSRRFKLFKFTFVWTSQQSVWLSSKFLKNPAFKCIRRDDVAIPSGHQSVFDQ
jgi:hypothetical protein